MRFQVPKRVAYLVIVGLVLLAVAGAADSIGNAMRENYQLDCHGPKVRFPVDLEPGSNETDNDTYEPPTPEEREECRAMRLPVTVMQAVTNAALAPGIAIVAISGVFLVAAAIAARQR